MADSQKYTSPVPTDYQEVEYIQSSGNGEYIDTGYVPTVNTKFNIDFQFIEATTPYYESIPIMGERSATAPNSKFGLWINKTSFKEALNFGSYDSSYSTTDITNANVRNVTSNIKANMYYNGVFVRGDNNAEFTTGDLSIYLFAINSSGTPDNRNCVVKLYRYKLYENDVLVRDFVPVYRKSDNVAGLYDTINDVFYTNQGTGSFTVGSNVSPWQHSLRKLTTATETIENPLYSDGTAITSYTIKGNTVQNGIPTPDNPVDANGVGERTENLAPNIGWVDGFISPNGSVAPADAVRLEKSSDFIPIQSGITLAYSYRGDSFPVGSSGSEVAWRGIGVYKSDKTFISRLAGAGTSTYVAQLPDNAAYIRLSLRTYGQEYVSNVMLNTGSTAKPYEPYGYKIPISNGQQTTNIYLGSTQTVRQIKKLVLTGNEDWQTQIGQYRNNTALFTLWQNLAKMKNRPSVNTHFISAASGVNPQTQNYVCSGYHPSTDYSNYYYIRPDFSTIGITSETSGTAAIAAFKTWLRNNPIVVYYVLANAETAAVNEPLMKIGDYADTLSNATAIPTTDGANSITVDTTVQPSEFTATWTGWHNASVKEWDSSDWQ